MAKVQPEDQHFDPRVKSSVKEWQHQRVVEIRYVHMPDADARLSRVINILLCSAARGTAKSEGSINAKKEEPPHQAPAEDTLTGGDGEQKNGNEGELPNE